MIDKLILQKNLNKLDSGNDDSKTNGEMLVFNSLIKNDSVVFDVGARDSFLPKMNSESQFHLFEPIMRSYQKLISEYGTNKNVKIVNNCLSDKIESVNIFLYTECINPRQGQPNESMGSEQIHCISLESYMENNNMKSIDFLKIDVEGYEFNVIKGLGQYIENVKYIMFEYGVGTYFANNVKLSDLISLLNNFEFFIVQNSGLIKINFNNKSEYERISSLGYCNILAKNINHE